MRKYFGNIIIFALLIAFLWRMNYLYGIESLYGPIITISILILFYFLRKRRSNKPRIIKKDAYTISGISTKTSNARNKSFKDIEKLWKEFYSEDIIHKISPKNKVGDEIYCIYTDYESDYLGEYTVVLGIKVNSLKNIPENLVSIKVEEGDFLKFKVKGKLPNALIETWQKIWRNDRKLNRSYISDFEVYNNQINAMNSSEVNVYIGVNKNGKQK